MNVTWKYGWPLAVCLMGNVAAIGCDGDKPALDLAPTSEKLAPPKPKSSQALRFEVQKSGSRVEFAMDAPVEKITGKVVDATSGEAAVDLEDLTKSTAHLLVDITGIQLFQRIKEKGDAEFGAEKANVTQNEHARAWLEINDENPGHEKNRRVEFAITSVKTATPDVTKLSGDERKVMATVSGDFLLHGHKTTKTAEVELTFLFKDGSPVSMRVKTTKSFGVGLAENDVRPRDAIGKLLAKGLDALSEKVSPEAAVSIDLTAALKGAAPTTPPAAQSASAAASAPPTASASAAAASASAPPKTEAPKKSY